VVENVLFMREVIFDTIDFELKVRPLGWVITLAWALATLWNTVVVALNAKILKSLKHLLPIFLRDHRI